MTPDNTPASVAVVQADRMLIVKILRQFTVGTTLETVGFAHARNILDGSHDDDPMLQAAAKHRLAFQQPGGEAVMIPREPTQAMMDAGLYASSHDSEWADVHSMWKAMFDAVTLDGGTSSHAPAPAPDAALREALENALDKCMDALWQNGLAGHPAYQKAKDAFALTQAEA